MAEETSCPTPEDVVRDAGAHIHREDDDSSCRPYLTEEDFVGMDKAKVGADTSTPFDTYQALVDFLPLSDEAIINYSSMLDYSFTKGFVLTSENIIDKINSLSPEEMAEFMTELIRKETDINPNRCKLFIDDNSNNSYIFMCDEKEDKPEAHDDMFDALSYMTAGEPILVSTRSLDEVLQEAFGVEESSEDDFQFRVTEVLNEINALLVAKNAKYGNSALEPVKVFSKLSDVEQILVRIDDKLSRIRNQNIEDDEDVVQDLIGYLILLRIAQRRD
jgi:hypothetical protein